jgi:hypothetical protein
MCFKQDPSLTGSQDAGTEVQASSTVTDITPYEVVAGSQCKSVGKTSAASRTRPHVVPAEGC